MIGAMKLLGATVAHIACIPEKVLTSSLVSALHDQGYIVHYHIAKSEMSEQKRIFNTVNTVGVDQCTFDDIGLIAQL